MNTTDRLLTAREVAERLGVCERTIKNCTAPRGDLQAVRIGAAVRYDPADVRAFVERRKLSQATT